MPDVCELEIKKRKIKYAKNSLIVVHLTKHFAYTHLLCHHTSRRKELHLVHRPAASDPVQLRPDEVLPSAETRALHSATWQGFGAVGTAGKPPSLFLLHNLLWRLFSCFVLFL